MVKMPPVGRPWRSGAHARRAHRRGLDRRDGHAARLGRQRGPDLPGQVDHRRDGPAVDTYCMRASASPVPTRSPASRTTGTHPRGPVQAKATGADGCPNGGGTGRRSGLQTARTAVSPPDRARRRWRGTCRVRACGMHAGMSPADPLRKKRPISGLFCESLQNRAGTLDPPARVLPSTCWRRGPRGGRRWWRMGGRVATRPQRRPRGPARRRGRPWCPRRRGRRKRQWRRPSWTARPRGRRRRPRCPATIGAGASRTTGTPARARRPRRRRRGGGQICSSGCSQPMCWPVRAAAGYHPHGSGRPPREQLSIRLYLGSPRRHDRPADGPRRDDSGRRVLPHLPGGLHRKWTDLVVLHGRERSSVGCRHRHPDRHQGRYAQLTSDAPRSAFERRRA